MSTWDSEIFNDDANEEFLAELDGLPEDDIVEAVRDACLLTLKQGNVSAEEEANGLAAATIAAIWAGAPFSAAEIVDTHPFIRDLIGSADAELCEAAAQVLETAETETDIDQFIEAVS
ncbi:DUF4259 domain-containing protein [Corynebacterium tapiri]|uniref:DUF4259 domain-containing protein n=1 Tax=Corynebacterium tapiri TaxID=1448266 RepID=A0A5C4U4D6_9CORY|nr:DUF4259 domain-containing protein [Corynebacterium tapiri]TNL98421.1 DUF4259 domain-containing protein [Corynebacterium tapiri]